MKCTGMYKPEMMCAYAWHLNDDGNMSSTWMNNIVHCLGLGWIQYVGNTCYVWLICYVS